MKKYTNLYTHAYIYTHTHAFLCIVFYAEIKKPGILLRASLQVAQIDLTRIGWRPVPVGNFLEWLPGLVCTACVRTLGGCLDCCFYAS